MKTVDLSLDFDFWVREDPLWDYGHAETDDPRENLIHLITLWQIRYQSQDLYGETDMAKFADFPPEGILTALASKKLRARKIGRMMVAESHRHAYDFFRERWLRQGEPDVLVHIDAHHDLWPWTPGQPHSCGNWLTRLLAETPVPTTVVYPGWKDHGLDGPAHGPALLTDWQSWQEPEPLTIRNVFLCRSGVWVPPHHDERFLSLAQILHMAVGRGRIDVPENIYQRNAPTEEEARVQREHYQQVLRSFMDQHKEEVT